MTTYHFQGKRSEFFPGIPARDLTERDIQRLDAAQVRTVETAKGPDGTPMWAKQTTRKAEDTKGQKGDGKQPDPKQD